MEIVKTHISCDKLGLRNFTRQQNIENMKKIIEKKTDI